MPVKKILSLPVVTESNVKLGIVLDVIFDVECHQARQYVVGRRLIGTKLFISPSQIISIDSEKVVVEDATLSESDLSPNNISVGQTAA